MNQNVNLKYWFFNTDEGEKEGKGAYLKMIQGSVIAAWGNCHGTGAEETLNRPNKGDIVFFYLVGSGIIARGEVGGESYKASTIFGANGEFHREVKDLNVLEYALTHSEVRSGSGYYLPSQQIVCQIESDPGIQFIEKTFQTPNLSEPEEDTFPEGRLLFRLHRLRERNQKVIEKAKAIERERKGKLCCSVCEFDFAAAYGKLGEDFIEGHHTTPLAYREGETETSVSDIALVCSNCHRMLHRRRPWLNIDQLQAILVKTM